MKATSIMLVAIAFVAVASAQDVTYNFDRGANFEKFTSYKWIDIPGGAKLDDLLTRQLTAAVEAELAKKGLVKTDSETANLYIGYQVALNREQQITAYNSGWGYGPRWGGSGFTTATTSTLTVGSLDLDMYDSSQKQLVWRGVATKTIDSGASPDKRQKNIQNAVGKLLKNYPPKQK